MDNSGENPTIFSTGTPGAYSVGRSWSIIYVAKDKSGNTAQCKFSFKLAGILFYVLHSV